MKKSLGPKTLLYPTPVLVGEFPGNAFSVGRDILGSSSACKQG